MKTTKTSFHEIIDKITSRQKFGIKPGLENVGILLDSLGSPHKTIKFIHVTGTNGKGSVSAIIASILSKAGFRTGLYTSPHLVSPRERIRVNGCCISEDEFVDIAKEVISIVESQEVKKKLEPTYFEVLSAIALKHFEIKKVEWAVMEAGMGGLLDATNIIDSEVQIITNVEKEHSLYLGKTVSEIAEKKSGIIRSGKILITAVEKTALQVLREKARKNDTVIWSYPKNLSLKISSVSNNGQVLDLSGTGFSIKNLFCPLLGKHQSINCLLAVSTVIALGKCDVTVKNDVILNGVEDVFWPGRGQVFFENGRMTVLDAGHTPRAAELFVKMIREFLNIRKMNLVFGLLDDKNIKKIVDKLAPVVNEVAVIEIGNERSMKADRLIKEWSRKISSNHIHAFSSLKELLKNDFNVFKEKEFPIAVVGSIYLIGEYFKEKGITFC